MTLFFWLNGSVVFFLLQSAKMQFTASDDDTSSNQPVSYLSSRCYLDGEVLFVL